MSYLVQARQYRMYCDQLGRPNLANHNIELPGAHLRQTNGHVFRILKLLNTVFHLKIANVLLFLKHYDVLQKLFTKAERLYLTLI